MLDSLRKLSDVLFLMGGHAHISQIFENSRGTIVRVRDYGTSQKGK